MAFLFLPNTYSPTLSIKIIDYFSPKFRTLSIKSYFLYNLEKCFPLN